MLKLFRGTYSLLGCLSVIWTLAAGTAFAESNTSSALKGINFGENKFIQFPENRGPIAKVRIPMVLTPFEKMVVTNEQGKSRYEFRSLPALKHMLRARIDQTNHFYINSWHIETIPIQWSRASQVLELEVRFYKRYGDSQELEESIGSLRMKGLLKGKDFLYVMHGHAQARFLNKLSHPIAEVSLGRQELSEKGRVATRKESSKVLKQ